MKRTTDSTERIFMDAMQEKAVEGAPRYKDPSAWSCLSDQQRDTICEWYYKRCIEEHQKNKRRESKRQNAMFFAVSPFAFAYGLQHYPFGFRMLLNAAAAFIFYAFVAYLFSEAYDFMDEGTTTVGRIFAAIRSAAISFFVTFCALSAVGVI